MVHSVSLFVLLLCPQIHQQVLGHYPSPVWVCRIFPSLCFSWCQTRLKPLEHKTSLITITLSLLHSPISNDWSQTETDWNANYTIQCAAGLLLLKAHGWNLTLWRYMSMKMYQIENGIKVLQGPKGNIFVVFACRAQLPILTSHHIFMK